MNHNRTTQRRTYHFAKRVPEAQQTASSKPNALRTIVFKINVVTPLASLVFGRSHSTAQRLMAGALVMAVGVMIAKYVGHSHNEIVAHIGDGIGYGLHGMGLIPFIESIASKFE